MNARWRSPQRTAIPGGPALSWLMPRSGWGVLGRAPVNRDEVDAARPARHLVGTGSPRRFDVPVRDVTSDGRVKLNPRSVRRHRDEGSCEAGREYQKALRKHSAPREPVRHARPAPRGCGCRHSLRRAAQQTLPPPPRSPTSPPVSRSGRRWATGNPSTPPGGATSLCPVGARHDRGRRQPRGRPLRCRTGDRAAPGIRGHEAAGGIGVHETCAHVVVCGDRARHRRGDRLR